MSFSTRIKSFEAAVKRLEGAAGMGERNCSSCRLLRRHYWPDPRWPQPRPEDLLLTECEFCHAKYYMNLPDRGDEEDEVRRLLHAFTLEDRFMNPRAHALELWFYHQGKIKGKPSREQGAPIFGRTNNKRDGGQQLLIKLRGEWDKLLEKTLRRYKAKHGARPFPEHIELIKQIRASAATESGTTLYVKGLSELEATRTLHLICAAMEKIFRGKVLTRTSAAIQTIEQDIAELIITATEAKKAATVQEIDLKAEAAAAAVNEEKVETEKSEGQVETKRRVSQVLTPEDSIRGYLQQLAPKDSEYYFKLRLKDIARKSVRYP